VRRTALLPALLVSVFWMALAPAPASAVEAHSFDPALSLRGDCSTSAFDEVPDPGLCPIPPGVAGIDHPPNAFEQPCGVATDSHGDIYVASAGLGTGFDPNGRIDVFDPQGRYLTEVKDEFGPCSLAVDSVGNLFVTESNTKDAVRFQPDSYPPSSSTSYTPRFIVHEPDPTDGGGGVNTSAHSLAIDPSNDHLYVGIGPRILEYEAAASGQGLLREDIGFGLIHFGAGIGVYGNTHQVYSTAFEEGERVEILDPAGTAIECEIDGSETPEGGFGGDGRAPIAVDQSNGEVYVGDIEPAGHESVDQFSRNCEYIGQLQHSLRREPVGDLGSGLAVDAPCLQSPNEICGTKTYESPNAGNLYVAQGRTAANYHLYAFKPKSSGPPEVQAQAPTGVGAGQATLTAKLNPHGLDTHYHFQYITQADYEADGGEYGAGALNVPTPDLDAGTGGAFAPVSVPVSGLQPQTAYRFRLLASNCEAVEAIPGECLTTGEGPPGGEGQDSTFRTYSGETGLPDHRAYELVTPSDTNGRIPTMSEEGRNTEDGFDSRLVSGDGESVVFGTEGGSIPALGGGGFHDTYEALRTPGGWQSYFSGLGPAQAEAPSIGGIAPDHTLAFWGVENDRGSLAAGNYLRLSGGSVEPIGLGDFGEDLQARGKWITAGASRIVFTAGTPDQEAIYDRSLGGPTELLSVLPGGQAAPAQYQGTAADGSAVAFAAQGNLYVRLDGTETVQAAAGTPVYGGLSAHGDRIVYLVTAESLQSEAPLRGEIFTCRVRAGACAGPGAGAEPTRVGSGDESILVNFSADGSHVYFVSPQQLDGGKGEPGGQNLYVWNAAGESVHFVATLTDRDVAGQPGHSCSTCPTDGLGLWVQGPANPDKWTNGGPGTDPSRTDDDGAVLLFESRARLTGYENAGFAEVYRYDATSAELSCLSCSPSGEVAHSDALLQTPPGGFLVNVPPVNNLAVLGNLSPDGRRAYFQTADRLSLADTDRKQDVYEWEAAGEGTCDVDAPGYVQSAAGCVYLISSGQSPDQDYLYGVTPSGSDVIFESSDTLVPQDPDRTPSLYDARVGGGFPPPQPPPGECLGEACQPAALAPPQLTPGTSGPPKAGNPKPHRRCRGAKARRHRRCRRPHHKRHRRQHHRTRPSHGATG
jgi:hypothetical protein